MSIKNSILFGLALLNEILWEFRDPGGFVSFSYNNLYGFVPKSYDKKSLYRMAHVLKKNGYVGSSARGIFSLTIKGNELVSQNFPLLRFLHYSWDGKWRMVGFDIEEKRKTLRNSFRKFLNLFGFRMLQKSLYISPLPIEEELKKFISHDLEIQASACIFICEQFFLKDDERFVNRVFHVTELNKMYKGLLQKIKGGLRSNESEILREFLAVSAKDPFLPKELLPIDFQRDRVYKALREEGLIGFG